MFSGFQSLFFKKKNHNRHNLQTSDDTAIDRSSLSDNDFVTIERRNLDDSDITPGLYPNLEPSIPDSENLPYAISPGLPDFRPQNTAQKTSKDGTSVDPLNGVPFQIDSYIHIISNEDKQFYNLMEKFKEILTEDIILESYNYDFNLENRILNEFQT